MLSKTIKYAVLVFSNIHRQGARKNILLFSTPRSGSTWMMEILGSQPGVKIYDEPFNIRRHNVQRAGRYLTWESLMPGGGEPAEYASYLEDIRKNRLTCLGQVPFRKGHAWLSDRIVFKIHELEHCINPLAEQCNGQVVYLLRHPIATTVSRSVHPRLEYFVNSPYYREECLQPEQVREIEKIVAGGDSFSRGIVSWCYENLAPLLHSDTSAWHFVTYEEALLSLGQACRLMKEVLSFDDLDRLLEAAGEPSSNIAMSAADTQALMRESDEGRKRRGMVTKWKPRVTPEQEQATFDILDLFGLDTYSRGSFVAHRRYLHHEETLAAAETLGHE